MLRIVRRSWASDLLVLVGDERGAQLGGEGLAVAADGAHVLVPGDGPEAGAVGLGVPEDRRLAGAAGRTGRGGRRGPRSRRAGRCRRVVGQGHRSACSCHRARGLVWRWGRSGWCRVDDAAQGADGELVGDGGRVDAAHHLEAEQQADDGGADRCRRRGVGRTSRRCAAHDAAPGAAVARGQALAGVGRGAPRSSTARARGRSSGRRRRPGSTMLRHSAAIRSSSVVVVVSSAMITAATSSTQPSSRANSRPSLPPKWSYTAPEVRPARSAMASTEASSTPRSANSSAAAVSSRRRVSARRSPWVATTESIGRPDVYRSTDASVRTTPRRDTLGP